MSVRQDESAQVIDGKIVRSSDPLNLEMPFDKLDGFITPTELFYVRTRFPVLKMELTKWRRDENAVF